MSALYNEYGDINFEEDNFSEGQDSYHGSNKKKVYNAMNAESQGVDPNFLQVKVKRNDGSKKMRKISCFMSGTTGLPIRNAVTGQKYRGHFVGKYDEDFYFKVMLCGGENGQTPATLFYDSPGQYEKHFFREVEQSIKDRWFQKLEIQQNR